MRRRNMWGTGGDPCDIDRPTRQASPNRVVADWADATESAGSAPPLGRVVAPRAERSLERPRVASSRASRDGADRGSSQKQSRLVVDGVVLPHGAIRLRPTHPPNPQPTVGAHSPNHSCHDSQIPSSSRIGNLSPPRRLTSNGWMPTWSSKPGGPLGGQDAEGDPRG